MLLNNLPGAAAVASAHKIVVTTDDGDKTITAEQLRAWAENEAAHPYNYGKEIALAWDEISTKTKKGDFTGLRIGDYKTVTLTTGEIVIMEIAGIDPYFGSGDQETGHHILWVSRDCLPLHTRCAAATPTTARAQNLTPIARPRCSAPCKTQFSPPFRQKSVPTSSKCAACWKSGTAAAEH